MKYEIQGGNFPVVICTLDPNESVISEGGGMSWMSPNMVMQTTSNGGLGKMLGRMVTKESMFQNRYTAQGGEGMIAFASSLPGEVMALQVDPQHEYVCQKSSFLASTEGVQLSVVFQKKLGAGLFGGEGFIMQRLSGTGLAFVEVDGSSVRYNLAANQQLVVSSGHVVMMSATCQMDIKTVQGAKNIVFGGEGLFNTVVTGPGEVVLQTLPISRLASSIQPYIVTGK